MKGESRFRFVTAVSLVLLLAVGVLSLRLGAVATPFAQVVQELSAGDGLVFEYRLPRLLVALLVGANLAVAGSILQGVTRNPLAAPEVMGITAGGGLVSALVLLTVPNYNPVLLPAAAFGGAVLAALLVYVLAYQRGMRPERLALTGVAVSSGLQALITLLIVSFAPSAAQALVWLKGSLYARTWTHVEMLWPWTLVGVLLAALSARPLNVLLLGEETVRGLGMRIDRTRLLLVFAAVAMAGSAVAVAGTIGFVGLVIPHLTRMLVGNDYRYVLPTSALLGALLVLAADTAGRSVLPPYEVPAGIITALFGAPYFVYLLVKRKTAW